ncbi:MAG: ABC transporter ATP-binding protein [Tidjanibacter sp.]|nr:ABC transporter ATP-binding protein [Tidjanibacter sp.]
MIQIENLRKSYGSLEVLRGVSLSIMEGEVVAIVGPSGAGKTTLLHAVATLSEFDSGKVVVDGVDVGALDSDSAADFRSQRVGMVFQFHYLLPEFTALENVCLPAYIAGREKSDVELRARELLDMMGLTERIDHKPSELSGGEQQRVAIARALINSPRLLLADEPSGNLDSHNRTEIHNLFFRLRDELGLTVVVVTHDEGLAQMSDRKITIVDGLTSNA